VKQLKNIYFLRKNYPYLLDDITKIIQNFDARFGNLEYVAQLHDETLTKH